MAFAVKIGVFLFSARYARQRMAFAVNVRNIKKTFRVPFRVFGAIGKLEFC